MPKHLRTPSRSALTAARRVPVRVLFDRSAASDDNDTGFVCTSSVRTGLRALLDAPHDEFVFLRDLPRDARPAGNPKHSGVVFEDPERPGMLPARGIYAPGRATNVLTFRDNVRSYGFSTRTVEVAGRRGILISHPALSADNKDAVLSLKRTRDRSRGKRRKPSRLPATLRDLMDATANEFFFLSALPPDLLAHPKWSGFDPKRTGAIVADAEDPERLPAHGVYASSFRGLALGSVHPNLARGGFRVKLMSLASRRLLVIWRPDDDLFNEDDKDAVLRIAV